MQCVEGAGGGEDWSQGDKLGQEDSRGEAMWLELS